MSADRMSSPGRRIVSLVPSVTETLVAWGVPPVACTRFCEQPELAHVGGTKDPDVAAIVALAPDVVVMCVEENRREDAAAFEAAGLAVTSLSIDTVADVAPAMQALGTVAGVDPPELVDRLAAQIDALVLAVAVGRSATPTDPARRPLRAFVPIWKRPWMTLSAGTYGSSLLELVGVVNVFADASTSVSTRYPQVSLEQAAAREPDVVLAPSEPYPFAARHVPLLEQVAPVTLVDGQDLFWWGARTPAAAQRLAHQLGGISRPADG